MGPWGALWGALEYAPEVLLGALEMLSCGGYLQGQRKGATLLRINSLIHVHIAGLHPLLIFYLFTCIVAPEMFSFTMY